MATLAELNQFIAYLNQQINIATVNGVSYGEPYVWGGQHLHLTPSNYQSVIHNRENGRGSYSDGTTYEAAAKAYCKRLFDAGLTDLYAYDCSGLGMYWLQNVSHISPNDKNAHGMMKWCTLYKDTPKRGWWCFHVNSSGRATHVAYMVDDTHTIEARGRKYGVVKRTWKKSLWDKWGVPKIWKEVIQSPDNPHPGHTPTMITSRPTTSGPQEGTTSSLIIKVRGRSVNVRRGPSTDFPIIFVAHKGETYPLISFSPTTGWYQIETPAGNGYITNVTKYTDMEETL